MLHEQERIAFHESAHAVVHHYFRHPIDRVEVGEDTGRCVVPAEWYERVSDNRISALVRREALIEQIIACCAGKCAMDRLHGYKALSDDNWRASDDYKQALGYARRANDGDLLGALRLIAWCERRAELLVGQQWP